MPDVLIRRTTVTIPSSAGGDQDITIAGMGTPKAAIFLLSGATAVDSPAATARLAVGFTNGSAHENVSFYSADANATSGSRTWRGGGTGTGRVLMQATTASAETRALFVSWITDGIRINWDVIGVPSCKLEVILFGGTDIAQVEVGSWTASLTAASVNIGASSGDPRLMIAFFHHGSDEGFSNDGVMGIGFSDGSNQASATFFDDRTAATMTTNGYVSNTKLLTALTVTGLDYSITAVSNSTGFLLDASAEGADHIGYIAFRFSSGVSIQVGTDPLPTTTGNFSRTGFGFKPGFGMMAAASVSAAVNTADTSNADGFTIASFDAFGLGSLSIGQDDGAADSDTSALISNTYISDYSGASGGTHYAKVGFVSFDSDGWTLNVNSTDGTAYKRAYFAIEANTSIDLPVNGLIQGQTLEGVTLTARSLLTVSDMLQSQLLADFSLAQHGYLGVDTSVQEQSLTEPALPQHNVISFNDLVHGQSMTQPDILNIARVYPNALVQAHGLDSPSLAQHGVLTPQTMVQSQRLTLPLVTRRFYLALADLVQGQSLTSPGSFITHMPLTPDALVQGQLLEQLTLLAHSIVSPAALIQSQSLGEPGLVMFGTVTGDTLVQGQVLTEPTLVQHGVLVPDGLLQSQLLTEGGFNAVIREVFPNSMLQGQILTQPALVTHQFLVVDGLGQVHLVTIPDLVRHEMLVVNSMSQGQQQDSPALVRHFFVTPHNMVQGQQIAQPVLYLYSTKLEGTLVMRPSFIGELQALGSLAGSLQATGSLSGELLATARILGTVKTKPVQ